MGRRDLLLEDLQHAAASLGSATLALRAGKAEHAACYVRRAIEKINVCTSELCEALERQPAERD